MSVVFDHVNVVVDDLEATQAFFVDNFGFVAGTVTTLEGAWVDELNGYSNAKATYVPLTPAAGGGTTRIEVLTFESPASPPASGKLGAPNHIGYRHICLDVPDIQAVYEQLKGDWQFLSEPVEVPPPFNVTTVYFIGPEGVLIQLTQKSQA
jgi:catechol 2,3-dioxygenase-like lactoylglutathione lyase family enzyme